MKLDFHAEAEMEIDVSMMAGSGPAYAAVFDSDEKAQDEEMELKRLHELLDTVKNTLQQARNDLTALQNVLKSEPQEERPNPRLDRAGEVVAGGRVLGAVL